MSYCNSVIWAAAKIGICILGAVLLMPLIIVYTIIVIYTPKNKTEIIYSKLFKTKKNICKQIP